MATQSHGVSPYGTPEPAASGYGLPPTGQPVPRDDAGYGAPEPGEQRSSDPDQIRREIEATRAELAEDVDRLADRTSPKRVARRGVDRVNARLSSIKETVMGAPRSAGSSVRDSAGSAGNRVQDAANQAGGAVQQRASDAADTVRGAASSAAETVRKSPDLVKDKARGNPLAVGLIAFGAGLLAATLLPETQAERQAGEKIADHGSDLIDQVREPAMQAANEIKQDVTESARQSAAEVKGTAQHAAQATADQAKASGQDARDAVQSTASNGRS